MNYIRTTSIGLTALLLGSTAMASSSPRRLSEEFQQDIEVVEAGGIQFAAAESPSLATILAAKSDDDLDDKEPKKPKKPKKPKPPKPSP